MIQSNKPNQWTNATNTASWQNFKCSKKTKAARPMPQEFYRTNKMPSSHLTSPLDYYQNAEGWKATNTCTLPDLIEAIREGTFAERVAEVRAFMAAGDKPSADLVKKLLPAVSLSGGVIGRRRAAVAEGRFQHSGLLQIDLDAKDNPGWSVDEMRTALQADPHIVAGFVTPSGEGVKGIARIPADAGTHKAAFLAAETHFAAANLTIDKSCKDPVRLCFVSHDPDAWCFEGDGVEIEPIVEEQDEFPPTPDDEDDEEHDERRQRGDRPARASHHVSDTGAIIIRGGDGFPELDASTVAEMLRCIPYPGYQEWLKITNAVWDALGEDGTPLLQAWAPEKKPGDYAEKWAHRLTDVTAATLVMRAKEHGWAPAMHSAVAPRAPIDPATPPVVNGVAKKDDKNAIPAHVFPVPAGDIGHDLAARHIFSLIGPSRRLFMRGTTVHEVAPESDGKHALIPVSADRFVAMVETFGPRVMRREMREDGTPRWRSTVFPASSAKVALVTDAARTELPPIRQVVSSPVIVTDGGDGTQVLCHGWHEHAGGTFVTRSDRNPPEVSLGDAKAMIEGLLSDFEFASVGDASRAIASFISPALKTGGWIEDDFPLDLAEADQSQSGKTFRQKLILAIYRETPSIITNSTGGVGSLDERVAAALIAGRPFITMENIRGRMDSQTLETAIRGQGRVTARGLRQSVDVDCSPFLWQLSTNGAELTRDLANRSIITRIRKRPETHEFQVYPEGDILAHVKGNQPRYLGAVHAIVRAWVAGGRQMTHESRHDFRVWCRILDWIVQEIFGFPPLLDGHREEQLRTANPKLQWLRDVVTALCTDGHAGVALTASDLAESADEHDLALPGRRDSTESAEMRVGKLLGRLFREAAADVIIVDGRTFSRVVEHEHDPIRKEYREKKSYVIDAPPPDIDDEGKELF